MATPKLRHHMNYGDGVDRSVGFVLAGLGVAAFVMLTIIGMQSVQTNAERATSIKTTETVTTPDLGGETRL